jgi:hypothetical protein
MSEQLFAASNRALFARKSVEFLVACLCGTGSTFIF